MSERDRDVNSTLTGAGRTRAGIEIDYSEGNLERQRKGGLI